MAGAQIYHRFCSSELLKVSFFPLLPCESMAKGVMITGWSMVLSSSALPCLVCSFQDIHTHDSLPPAYSDVTECRTLGTEQVCKLSQAPYCRCSGDLSSRGGQWWPWAGRRGAVCGLTQCSRTSCCVTWGWKGSWLELTQTPAVFVEGPSWEVLALTAKE